MTVAKDGVSERREMAGALPATLRDLARRPPAFIGFWMVPAVAMAASAAWWPGSEVIVWPIALAWMGGGCLLNAWRCGRLHCYVTGPLFLLLAGLALLHGLGVLRLGPQGWWWLGIVAVAVGAGISYLTERMWGPYVGIQARRKPT